MPENKHSRIKEADLQRMTKGNTSVQIADEMESLEPWFPTLRHTLLFIAKIRTNAWQNSQVTTH